MKNDKSMIRLALLAMVVALPGAATAAVSPGASAALWQGGKATPAGDAKEKAIEVAKLSKDLAAAVRAKASRDGAGVAVLDKLSAMYPKLDDKLKKAVAKAVSRVFRARRKPDEVVLLLAAGEALSRYGKPGANALAKVVENKKFRKRDWSAFRSQMVRLLGRPAEPKHIKLLIDIALKDNDDQARAKAGEALGDYAVFDQKVRKPIVDKLVKGLNEAYSQAKANIDANDLGRKVWEDRFAAIQDPWIKSLTKHTGQSLKEVLDWVKWYQKNKRKNWDKLGFRGVAAKPK